MEYIVEICVAIDTAILSIAYPIIVDKISNIGDKFNSQYIPEIFNTEFPHRSFSVTVCNREFKISFFKLVLYTTVSSFLLLIIAAPPLFGWNNCFINNSADLTVLTLTIFLTILFFIWLDKVVLYNGKPTKLLLHIINKYNSTQNKPLEYELKAINDITFYAVEKQDDHLQKTLLSFYYTAFSSARQQHKKSEPVVYHKDLYELIYRLAETLVNTNNRKLKGIEHRAVSGNWLLGEGSNQNNIISETTYNSLWRVILIICDHPRLIKMFWKNSTQYFDSNLKPIRIKVKPGTTEIINQEEINIRDTERQRFLEFHYALGGLMLYREQYKTVKFMFEYSDSHPPHYPLLPVSMTEIFRWYDGFYDDFDNRFQPLDWKYPFPDMTNLGLKEVAHWLCTYLVTVFVRQFMLPSYYVYQNPTEQASLPTDISELYSWKSSTEVFKRTLVNILENQSMLQQLGLDTIVAQKKDDILHYVDELIERIHRQIGYKEANAPLEKEKIDNFKRHSREILTSAFNAYKHVFTDTKQATEGGLKLAVTGGVTLMSKSALADSHEHHMNYDSVFANMIAEHNILRQMPNSFLIARTRRYLIKRDNLIAGIKKITAKAKNCVVVGINVDYEINTLLIQNSINVRFIHSSQAEIDNYLYVLQDQDLPTLYFNDIDNTEKEKLAAFVIDETRNIYGSVLDINLPENKEIRDAWPPAQVETELKVQIGILIQGIISWPDDRDIVQINIASNYKEQGIQNDINEIEPLKEK